MNPWHTVSQRWEIQQRCCIIFNDVNVFHTEWDDHIIALNDVFEIFKVNYLRIKPNKTDIGFPTIQFLGHTNDRGLLKPIDDKVNKIMSIKTPNTKKGQIIGLVNFYAKYIPQVSDLLFPSYKFT